MSISYPYIEQATSGGKKEKKIRYGARDEESKININLVKPEIISIVFQALAKLDEDEANEIAYSIVDWRDPDSFLINPSYGAEDDYYDEKEPPYEAKDAHFQVVEELLLVRGMDEKIFDQVKDYITIFGSGAVNINTASREILGALQLSDKAIDAILAYRRGTDNEEATEDDRAFTAPASITSELSRVYVLPASDVAVLSSLAADAILGTESASFMIRSVAQFRAMTLEIQAVVEKSGNVQFFSGGIPQRIRAPLKSGPGGEEEPAFKLLSS